MWRSNNWQPSRLVCQTYVRKRKGAVKMHMTVLKLRITRKHKCDRNVWELWFMECTLLHLQSWNNEFSIQLAYGAQISYKNSRCSGGRVVSRSVSHQCGPCSILGWGSDPSAVNEKGFVSVWATLFPWVGTLSRWPSLSIFTNPILGTLKNSHASRKE